MKTQVRRLPILFAMETAFLPNVNFAGGSTADKHPENQDAELLAFRLKLSQEPEKYIRNEFEDGIAFGWLAGLRYVYGCSCNGITRYENFIWENRKLILSYLEKRSSAMMGDAMEIKSGIIKSRGAK